MKVAKEGILLLKVAFGQDSGGVLLLKVAGSQ